jgi:hypothetical protein
VKAVSFVLAAASVLFSASVLADKRLSIPVDPRAKWMIIDKTWLGGDRVVVTKRVAREGIRYSKFQYDCEKGMVKSLGESERLDDLADVTSEAKMSLIAPESVPYYISLEACKYLKDADA